MHEIQNTLGKKIVIVGVSASGKSTFGRALAKQLDLPLTLMDEVMWRRGWQYVGDEETAEALGTIIQNDEWIIEGYIVGLARTKVFARADTIIYLDYPRYVCLWRYIKRVWKHRKKPRPELPGSPEKFSVKFLWLVWTKGEAVSLNTDLKKFEMHHKILTFTSPKNALAFLDGVSNI